MVVLSFLPTPLLIRVAFTIILGAVHLLAFDPTLVFADSSKAPPAAAAGTRQTPRRPTAVSAAKERFPLYFVENRGQVDRRAAYYIHGADKVFYFGAEGVTMVLSKAVARQTDRASVAPVSLRSDEFNDKTTRKSISRTAVTLEFVGANSSVKPVGEELSAARFSYFTGPRENWTVGLRSYQKLVYPELWPGIDLIYTASADRLKYMFVVKPGADPKRIRLRYRGAESVSLDNEGKLLVHTALDDFHDDKPAAHQEIDGRVVGVNAQYTLLREAAGTGHAYGFDVGAYDSTNVLVIDPAILVYAGFIGGTGNDRGNAIAVDVTGNAYITGETSSLQSSFPVTGGLDAGQNGGVDAFVAKVDSTGTQLLFAGFIGGAGDDRGNSIAVDSLGNAYISGETSSDQTTFPVTIGPDLSYNGAIDAFVAKVNAAGTNLVYAGYIGGLNLDRGLGIAVDSSNRAYVTGETASSAASFPNGAGFGSLSSFDSSHNGNLDAFVARVAANGASLEYAGYIGGIGTDGGTSIAVDGLNRAYITGETDSSSASFPNGIGFAGLTSFDSSINGVSDAFVARIASDGQSLSYAGYIGGSLADRGNGIVVDDDGNAYVTGETSSDANSFPSGNGLGGLPGPGQVQRGGIDAFVAKINAAGNALVYAGYIGGAADDRANAITLLPGCANNCDVYITGETSSLQSSFPVSIGPDLTHNGGIDAFIAKINANGSLGLAGYLGGAADDRGKGIALDSFGDVYLTGDTNSNETTFPIKGRLDRTQNLAVDAFVAKICVTTCADVSVTKSDSPDPVTVGASVNYTITVTNDGADTATEVELTDVLPSTVSLVSVTSSVGSCTGSSTIVCDLGDLANGASATVNIVVTTMAVGKLTNTATVSSDETDTDPSNNSVEQQTIVTLPDLAVKSISTVAAAIPGSAVVVNDTTTNKGKVVAGASVTRFYLSSDSKFDGADTLLGSRSIPTLSPKASSSGSTTLTIPSATALGRYFLIAVADADTGVPETKEKNSKARSLTVTLPDLAVQTLRGPSSAAAAASIGISDTTSNKAPVGAGGSTTQYYLSVDGILDGGDVLLGSRSVPALGAKGRSAGSVTVTIPSATTPGRYFLLAVSDGGGAVSEVDENNNIRSKSITVTP
jgi:uncharacterized repeat protein (TIGR01451 family)